MASWAIAILGEAVGADAELARAQCGGAEALDAPKKKECPSNEGKKERRKEGKKERRKEGKKERRKEGKKERRKEGKKERRKEGKKERRKEGKKERRKEKTQETIQRHERSCSDEYEMRA